MNPAVLHDATPAGLNLRVLIVEDSEADTGLLVRELERFGYCVSWQRVASVPELQEALGRQPWDLVLSDYSMPGFNGLEALATVKAGGFDLPFILISGMVGEELAVECVRAGACDYLLKDRLARLGASVDRALSDAGERRSRQAAEEALRKSDQSYRTLVENAAEAIIVAQDGRLKFANAAGEALLGYAREEIASRRFDEFVHLDDRSMVLDRYRSRMQGLEAPSSYSFRIVNRSGDTRWVQISAVMIEWEGRPATLNFLSDITERQRVDEQLRAALREKETLLRELYHRTRNNMQVISSMLELQAAGVDDPVVQRIVQETRNRIRAMALVHEKLYRSQSLSTIRLDEYIVELVGLLQSTYQVTSNRIALAFDVEPVSTSIDVAMPCSLMVNELVSNALTHAFPGKRAGEIRVSLHREGSGSLVLEVSDDGVGQPAGFNWRETETLGLQTVVAIGEHQLQGSVTFEAGRGVTCRVCFRDDLYRPST